MALSAKFATTCGVCRQAIKPGDPIIAAPQGVGGKWAHDGCEPLPDLFGEATAAPALTQPRTGEVTGQQAENLTGTTTDAVLQVWTDGACSGNPGPGGWAWATRDGRQGSGGESPTTNQRMEIRAALEAVTTLEGPLQVISDSTYVVNCFRDGWWRGWLARGWQTSAKKPVANRDLWEPLVDVVRARGNVSFTWVKGHSGDEMNDKVDALAVQAGKELSGR